ncbi:MAG: hypothetical protein ACPHK8_00955 [Thermoplasmatota archaeon]
MKRVLAMLLVVALAGCLSSDSNDDNPDVGSSTSSSSGGSSSSTSESHGDMHHSVWNVTSINGTFTGNITDGFDNAPVFFNWTANYILNGTEADFFKDEIDVATAGGNFSWSFDQDSDGTPEATGELVPFNLTVLYAPGAYVATLTMTGHGHTWIGTHNLTIEEYIPPIPPTVREGIVSEPCPACGGEQGSWDNSIGHLSGEQGIDAVWFEIPADIAGAPFVAGSTAGDIGISFQDSCNGAEIEHFIGGPATGTVPGGAGCVFMWQEGTIRGSKLSFIANGDLRDREDDGLCWADDFLLLGFNQAGVGIYQTDGTWFYAEDNGIPGLQWNENPSPGLAEVHKEGCTGGDLMLI